MDRLSAYQSVILGKIPLLLSLQDREENSPTFGSFDRTYWQWKFTDFPDARFQEALLTLSYVYSADFEGNIYRKNPGLLKWIEAGFLFPGKIQHRDGSFDEAYPFERSFVATAFTLFYLTEALYLVRDTLSQETLNSALATLSKAGDWLVKNGEDHAFISNHRLGAGAGLYNLANLTSRKKYEHRCWQLWETVKAAQSKDGWFNEYGGADPGYLTQGIYYAAVLYKRSKNRQVLESLLKAADFMKYFIHPDGTLGGEYGSRNTEFYFPGGFEILAKDSPAAEAVCSEMIQSVAENRVPSAGSVDVYNVMPLLNSMASGCIFHNPSDSREPLPFRSEKDFARDFDDYKISVRKSGGLYTIAGTAKGGVLKVFDCARKKLVKSCVGVFGKINGRTVTSQFLHSGGLETEIRGDSITIKGDVMEINYTLLSPAKMILFRLFALACGLMPPVSGALKKAIVNTLISRKKPSGFRFERTLYLDRKPFPEVETKIEGLPAGTLKEYAAHTSYHMGSSRYYKISDLY